MKALIQKGMLRALHEKDTPGECLAPRVLALVPMKRAHCKKESGRDDEDEENERKRNHREDENEEEK